MKPIDNLISTKKNTIQYVRIVCILVFLGNTLHLYSQANVDCGYVLSSGSQTTTSQNCVQLLNDFVPLTTDPTIFLKVHFYAFAPATNSQSGIWTSTAALTTSNDAQFAINVANSTFSNIPAPKLGTSGHIQNSKIQLVMGSFQYVLNDNLYNSISAPSVNPQYSWDGINVYLAPCSYTYMGMTNSSSPTPTLINGSNCASAVNFIPGIYPNNFIKFRPKYGSDNDLKTFGVVLAHEVCHTLGLDHSTRNPTLTAQPAGWSYITNPRGCSTCTQVLADDFTPDIPLFADCTVTANYFSNNLMSQQALCLGYLSPMQMAVMHYNLRTIESDYLTSNSYTSDISVNHASDYSITTNAAFTTDRFFKGNITIKAGSTLTVTCNLFMTAGSKIIVEKGAKLVVDGGTVTCLYDRLWGGIDVVGDITQNQNINSSTGYANQGILIVKNGGTISNSVNGVRNYGFLSNGGTSYGTTGGIIIGDHARFINNVRDIEFLGYPFNFGSASRFDNCEFKTTDNVYSAVWNFSAPYVHVSLWQIKGVQFNGCIFEGDIVDYPYIGQGIHSIDAIYTVNKSGNNPSVFKDFSEGISVINSNSLCAVNIYDTKFINNITGIEFSTMTSAIISGNSFTMTQQASKGVALNYCSLYSVNNNTFTGIGNPSTWKAGVYAVNSGVGAHRIYRNDFRNLYLGISPQFDNSGVNNTTDGLFMNCNTFTASASIFDIAMQGSTAAPNLNATVAKYQGAIVSPFDPKKLVRNQYGATCAINGQRRWYVDYSSSKTIEHAANSNAVTSPTPQPNCSSTLLNVVNSGQSLIYSSHCLPSGNRPAPVPECPNCLYSDISRGLSAELANTATLSSYVTATIDGGNTAGILNAINSGTLSNTSLKDLLIASSPYLSDTVLKKYFNTSSVTADYAIFVHNRNTPVSSAVWSVIANRGFSGAAMDSISARQQRGGPNSRLALEGQLNLAKADLQFMYSEKLNYFLRDTLEGAQDTVIKLLSQNLGGIPNTIPQLVNAYANAGYYTRAFSYADSLRGIAKYTELMTLELGFLKLDTAKSGIYKILNNPALMRLIIDYASDSTKAGSMAARAILHTVIGTNMNFVYLFPANGSGSRMAENTDNGSEETEDTKKESAKNLGNSFKVYPNPANTHFVLLYTSANSRDVYYSISDVLNKEIKSGIINPNAAHEISVDRFNNGIYFITLIQENVVIEKRKLIIMK